MQMQKCYFHKSNQIIKFCKLSNKLNNLEQCTLPLCIECQQIHSSEHKKDSTESQIILFKTAYQTVSDQLQNYIEYITQSKQQDLRRLQQDRSDTLKLLQNYYNDEKNKIRQYYKINQIEEYYAKLKKGSIKTIIYYYAGDICTQKKCYQIQKMETSVKQIIKNIGQQRENTNKKLKQKSCKKQNSYLSNKINKNDNDSKKDKKENDIDRRRETNEREESSKRIEFDCRNQNIVKIETNQKDNIEIRNEFEQRNNIRKHSLMEKGKQIEMDSKNESKKNNKTIVHNQHYQSKELLTEYQNNLSNKFDLRNQFDIEKKNNSQSQQFRRLKINSEHISRAGSILNEKEKPNKNIGNNLERKIHKGNETENNGYMKLIRPQSYEYSKANQNQNYLERENTSYTHIYENESIGRKTYNYITINQRQGKPDKTEINEKGIGYKEKENMGVQIERIMQNNAHKRQSNRAYNIDHKIENKNYYRESSNRQKDNVEGYDAPISFEDRFKVKKKDLQPLYNFKLSSDKQLGRDVQPLRAADLQEKPRNHTVNQLRTKSYSYTNLGQKKGKLQFYDMKREILSPQQIRKMLQKRIEQRSRLLSTKQQLKENYKRSQNEYNYSKERGQIGSSPRLNEDSKYDNNKESIINQIYHD